MRRPNRELSAVIIACLLICFAAAAQDLTLFRADTRLVVLHTTVVDRDDKLVTNLPQKAFRVFESGVEQQIKIFKREDVPVSLGLVIDNSGSMRDRRQKVEAASVQLVKASNPQDQVFIVNFNDEAYLDVPFTNETAKLEEGVARIDSRGGTAMRDAIAMSIDYMRSDGKLDKKIILVVTDGNDNMSSISLEQLVQKAQQAEVLIYAVGLLNEEDKGEAKKAKRALDAITTASGGLPYYPEAVSDIAEIALRVAHEIRNQYTLAYTPSNAALDGSYRQIKVTVNGPNRPVARTRTGYYATAEPRDKARAFQPPRQTVSRRACGVSHSWLPPGFSPASCDSPKRRRLKSRRQAESPTPRGHSVLRLFGFERNRLRFTLRQREIYPLGCQKRAQNSRHLNQAPRLGSDADGAVALDDIEARLGREERHVRLCNRTRMAAYQSGYRGRCSEPTGTGYKESGLGGRLSRAGWITSSSWVWLSSRVCWLSSGPSNGTRDRPARPVMVRACDEFIRPAMAARSALAQPHGGLELPVADRGTSSKVCPVSAVNSASTVQSHFIGAVDVRRDLDEQPQLFEVDRRRHREPRCRSGRLLSFPVRIGYRSPTCRVAGCPSTSVVSVR